MFRSKKDVDAHVRDVFSKCSEHERVQHCFGIAKQYAGIKEFDCARRYMDTYLGSNPVNAAEGYKLMGDIQLELGDSEKALEAYKASYNIGNGKESLNRVCDLLHRGIGNHETPESRKKWFELQKLPGGNNSMNASMMGSYIASPGFAASKRNSMTPGPPKSGFMHSPFTNGNGSPLVTSASKPNGGNVDLQLRYLERRFDDGLGKILDQNSIVLEQMMRLKDEMKEMAVKIDQIASTQEKLEADIKNIQEKQSSIPAPVQPFQPQSVIPTAFHLPCRKCETQDEEAKNALKEKALSSSAEVASLREQMDKLEKLTISLIDKFPKEVPVPSNQFHPQARNVVPVPVPAPIQTFPQTVDPKPEYTVWNPAVQSATKPLAQMLFNEVPLPQRAPNPSNEIPDLSKLVPVKTPIAEPPKSQVDTRSVPLSELFKPAEGTWNCAACYVSNGKDTTSCVACCIARPGYENEKPMDNSNDTIGVAAPAAQFSFGFPQAPTTNTPPSMFSFNTSSNLNETPKKEEETASPFTGVNLAGKFSFADLAKNNNSSFTFGTGSSNPSFAGSGGQLFSSFVNNKSTDEAPAVQETKNTSANAADDGEDDFVPTAEFQPVIPLPPLVEVKKGDENENTIVEYRAKLYRFVEETKEWKERGVGNIKLLQSKDDERKSRVVMWREKVGKLACNFSLFPDIKVDHYQGNPKILLWKCQDHIEAPSWETFTLRFGNEENCKHFKGEMERLAKLTQKSGESPNSGKPIVSVKTPTTEPEKSQPEAKNAPLSALFKKAEGSWNCAACYLNNDKDAKACLACATVRPGYENENAVDNSLASTTVQPTFSFGFPAAPATNSPSSMFSFNTSAKQEETPKKEEDPSPFAGLNLAGKFSFADIAKNNNSSFTFGTGNSTPSFAGTGGQLFSSFSTKTSNDTNTAINTSTNAEDAVDGEDDFVPTAEFQPVIPLPPLVEVKKGDENENTIVEYRAKLYRFVEETKEWKERGVGNIKLLQSKDDERKSRVVMWREKVGKLACNFSLFPDMKVDHYQSNPKTLIWKCQDHIEAPSWETFTLRFGNEENCKHFKAEMERLAKMTQKSGESPDSGKQVSVKTPTFESQVPQIETRNVPLSALFKKAEGSWSCAACYLSNDKDAKTCVACATVRPGCEDEKPADNGVVPAVQPSFSFGFPTTTATINSTTSNSTFSFNETNKSEETPKKDDTAAAAASPFAGLNLAGKFSFADLAKNNNSSYTFGTGSSTPSFAGTGGQLFSSFANKSSEDTNATNNTSANAEDGEDDFVPTAEFQPVIPLPPLVEVKKGDENENTIVEYRAKLYRFVEENKEWKERGVGNIKLMQSKDDPKKSRVVMWREKIGKLACNFSLFPDIKIDHYQNNPKILLWKCQDHTEAPTWETFTLRFGNEENCKHFKEEMERLAKLTQKSSGESPESCKQVSAQSGCPGCAGCDPESYVMPNYAADLREQLIDLPLSPSSSQERLSSLSLDLGDDSTQKNSNSLSSHVQVVPEIDNSTAVNTSANDSFSSFSFSLKSPESNSANTSLTSFQLKTPTFSFKTSDGVPSIFSPPSITASAGNNAASPFASPFTLNNSSSPLAPINFASPTFQLPAQSADDEDGENQEEDEYEDVDEEDECMFEEDAHIFIQNEADSTDSFEDKGECVIRVFYDGESYCARLVILVDGEPVTEHLVASDTAMNPAGDLTYEWNGICNYETNCTKSRIKAVFTKEEAFQSFSDIMRDSLEFAEQAGITEAVLLEESYQ